jgi:hypothetical protein
MPRKVIKGVGVETDSRDLQNCKSIEDVEKLEIFSHLSKKDQDEANSELWDFVKDSEKED